MQIISTVWDLWHEHSKYPQTQKIGFVPTMGYLHEGHLSLVRKAREENDRVIVSIFVNPTQFAPHEDLTRYPRDLPRDLQMLEETGVDIVFTPTPEEMYPPNYVTYAELTGPLVQEAEGAIRPGHFRGVATVVLKLFQITQPHQAYFGQKDAQQAAVISRMIWDFNLPVNIKVLPIIRESNGLAMSSRNRYLSQEERTAATVVYKALQSGRTAFEDHLGKDPSVVIQAMKKRVLSEPRANLDYAQVRNPETFIDLKILQAPALLLVAARVGPTRLLDNFLLRADTTWDVGEIRNQT